MKSLPPNNLGKKVLVEQCQKITVNSVIRQINPIIKKALIETKLECMGLDVEIITSQTRYWFKCPKCEKRIGVLYQHPISNEIGCRICLNLDYRTRMCKGMIESLSLQK